MCHVAVDVLHVVVFFEGVEKLLHALLFVLRHFCVVGRQHGDIAGEDRDVCAVDGVAHSCVIFRCGEDLIVAVFAGEIFSAGFESELHELVFAHWAGFFVDGDGALAFKHEADAAIGAEVAAAAVEMVTDIAGGAVFVVGQAFDDQRNAARTIAFVGDVFVFFAIGGADAFLDGAVDVVVWHVVGFCLVNGQLQCSVVSWISATLTSSNGDVARVLGECGGAQAVHFVFLSFNIMNTTHSYLSLGLIYAHFLL